ncbi:hypothetical protein AM1_D0070 (plasmid) [Acaryochloris marina MBIC11017]|uniref:Uncharacterized protein n=1 Tax=Acaryochloris marina (strain MBIC 11017) TaxID=329726 RepID=A8ZNH9_ACAM1|nr:hypothetical protein AM1_D0070 [Acaryochloris marina MBIC11017]
MESEKWGDFRCEVGIGAKLKNLAPHFRSKIQAIIPKTQPMGPARSSKGVIRIRRTIRQPFIR